MKKIFKQRIKTTFLGLVLLICIVFSIDNMCDVTSALQSKDISNGVTRDVLSKVTFNIDGKVDVFTNVTEMKNQISILADKDVSAFVCFDFDYRQTNEYKALVKERAILKPRKKSMILDVACRRGHTYFIEN